MQEYTFDTVIVGTGCAGYNCADWLYTLGRRDLAIVTRGRLSGASRNTGSDKQTYYKLSLASGMPDSVRKMARDLCAGGGVNAGVALAEAAGSTRSFMKLVNLGVPFPAMNTANSSAIRPITITPAGPPPPGRIRQNI